MNTELRLHGHITDSIEYYATAAGKRLLHHHFYQISEQRLRLFSPGNELILSEDGIKQTGNGGTFCEYMFGVDQPLADLTKGGILNRLTLHGASYNSEGLLEIGKQNNNQCSYPQLFFAGHAVANYAFFVDGVAGSSHPQKQEQILRLLGRRLKRLPHLNQRDDSELVSELLKVLPEQATIYLVRLINMRNKRYQQQFQKLYYQHRQIPDEQFNELQTLANDLGIDRYQQERIRVDVMYHHRDNYRIIDEYRRTLIQCHRQGYMESEQHTQLTRLKTLSVRNKIPSALLLTLDDQLKIPARQMADEPEYMSTSRNILQKMFQPYRSGSGIDTIDMEQLLFAKQQAQRNRNHGFEQLLLETGKKCDEEIRDGAPMSLLENFSYIITFFDRYDSSLNLLSQMAFMENFRLSETILRSLLGNQQAFNQLSNNLFGRLLFDDILGNGYLGRFGRRKLDCLEHGLNEAASEQITLAELENRLRQLDAEERLYNTVLQNAKERIRNRYSRYETDSEQQQLFTELSDELLVRGIISDLLDPGLFRNVIHDIKKEAIYLHSLLPEIISTQDHSLREDFLSNSGLDRFYVEELEREYFSHNQIDLDQLTRLRAERR